MSKKFVSDGAVYVKDPSKEDFHRVADKLIRVGGLLVDCLKAFKTQDDHSHIGGRLAAVAVLGGAAHVAAWLSEHIVGMYEMNLSQLDDDDRQAFDGEVAALTKLSIAAEIAGLGKNSSPEPLPDPDANLGS